DFADFRAWPSFELPPGSITAGHTSGPRRLYYRSLLPPEPGAPFPDGTILVKALETDDPTTWEIHAMARRGSDFNAGGARGWEFFDLAIDAHDEVVIEWRGEGPPAGMGYPGEDGSCNSCHALVPERDFVFDYALFF